MSGGRAFRKSSLISVGAAAAGREAGRRSRKCWLRTSSRMSSGRASRKVMSMPVSVMSTSSPWIEMVIRSGADDGLASASPLPEA
jgi:hypothetical protein